MVLRSFLQDVYPGVVIYGGRDHPIGNGVDVNKLSLVLDAFQLVNVCDREPGHPPGLGAKYRSKNAVRFATSAVGFCGMPFGRAISNSSSPAQILERLQLFGREMSPGGWD